MSGDSNLFRLPSSHLLCPGVSPCCQQDVKIQEQLARVRKIRQTHEGKKSMLPILKNQIRSAAILMPYLNKKYSVLSQDISI